MISSDGNTMIFLISMKVSESDFISFAHENFRSSLGDVKSIVNQRLCGLFGTYVEVCVVLWELLCTHESPSSHLRYILWALIFLKSYANKTVLSASTGVDEKTERLWIWRYLRAIAELKLVS